MNYVLPFYSTSIDCVCVCVVLHYWLSEDDFVELNVGPASPNPCGGKRCKSRGPAKLLRTRARLGRSQPANRKERKSVCPPQIAEEKPAGEREE